MRRPRAARPCVDRSAFAGFRFPPEVITVAVRWYLRYGLSYRDVEELLAERGVEVDHVTVYRWVQRFTPLFAEAARPLRHATGDRWFVDETYVKVAGRWRYLYRAVDQYGQVIDVLLSEQRDTAAARRFFVAALRHGPAPVEVTTDKAGPYLRVLDDLIPAAAHVTEQYANNPTESDHARLKARMRPMRGLKRLRSAARIAAGHAFVQNLRRGHYELATEAAAPGPRIHRARRGHVISAASEPDACPVTLDATGPRGRSAFSVASPFVLGMQGHDGGGTSAAPRRFAGRQHLTMAQELETGGGTDRRRNLDRRIERRCVAYRELLTKSLQARRRRQRDEVRLGLGCRAVALRRSRRGDRVGQRHAEVDSVDQDLQHRRDDRGATR
jgi:transposase, IS6 family